MIYCVEDERNIRELIVYMNQRLAAKGWRAGRNSLRSSPRSQASLILLDIMLPEIDGLEILHMLRENPATKHLPVMMLTAKGTEFDTVSGLDAALTTIWPSLSA